MAVNYSRVTQGSAQRGWTAGSIAPRATDTRGPIANIGTSGNIPSNILQAIGNLSAEQAFRNLFSGGGGVTQTIAPPAPMLSSNPAVALQEAQQKAAADSAARAQQQLSLVNQNLLNFPALMGGIAPMGMGAPRAAMQQQQFGLENQIAAANAAAFAAAPRMSGWVGGF